MKKKTIAILGTLDTKESEAFYLRDRIKLEGCDALVIDVGGRLPSLTLGEPDISLDMVVEAAGTTVANIDRMERGAVAQVISAGAANLLKKLCDSGRIDGAIGYGGSFGSIVVSEALKALPIGFPKFIVATSIEGAAKFIGIKDIAIVSSITDMAGGATVNKIEAKILANAAGAISGMAKARVLRTIEKPVVVSTQMGVTTPCISECKKMLEANGSEMVAFHAIGSGGKTVETLVEEGFAVGVLDVTLAEISNELVGGVCTAGPDRLTAAGKKGVSQVICPGALDMVNFWGPGTTNVPEKFRDRRFYFHNPMVTLMRIDKRESVELGKIIADKVNKAIGPTVLVIPLRGWCSYDVAGGVKTRDYKGNQTEEKWYNPEADAAFVETLEGHLDLSKSNIDLLKVDRHINDQVFARILVTVLNDMITGKWKKSIGS